MGSREVLVESHGALGSLERMEIEKSPKASPPRGVEPRATEYSSVRIRYVTDTPEGLVLRCYWQQDEASS